MLDDYRAVEQFIRAEILEKKLGYNQLDITRSAILAITRGFESKGWQVKELILENSRFKRYEITSTDGVEKLSMIGGKVFRHPSSTEYICRRKHLTKRMLDYAQLRTPLGADFSPKEKAVAGVFFEMMPKPVVVKATDSGGSNGVTVGVTNQEEFSKAWDHALSDGRQSSNVLVEEFVTGVELRGFVVGNEVVSVVARIQPFIVGDGTSTMESLIKQLHEERKIHYRAMKMPVKIDWHFIKRQGKINTSVPREDEVVFLNPFNTPTVGALVLDVTDGVHPNIKQMAISAKNAIPELEIAGVDLLVADLGDENSAHVLEVNTAAALELHRYPTHGGGARPIEHDIVEYFHSQFLARKA
ncbi:phosphoribosylglycinamide synthetase ATP-grasp domain protein [Corynebacterium ammoniagenes]|uniref:Phosphoribosylamine--glycine ligase n=1 Tax=Corynebacterium ammoniagenes DSM 20306 TaxID=649754 RepID=A0ABN0ABT3_CORAM|nr:phosphoribosylglycinamide synthetase ATP-grasp domain protein [Corynebacterium ammoniagenes]APT82187.1 hypothetical protein CAMM_04400 [Corynebacterium ammoniagenes DSM 20306]AQS73285.1 hypothetical protein CA40472_04730 [Corynebacterium ammoniagenes]EFG80243.1 putative phosphoribosylamine--glycine ligase [Corynebacterium ammoniagenes DSM 20306]